MVTAASITSALGIGPVEDIQDLHPLIDEGFNVNALGNLSKALRVSSKTLLEAIDIAVTTFQRRSRKGERLHTDESDRLFRAARVFALAVDVLGSEAEAAGWFQEEIIALGGERPIDKLRTSFSVREVEDVLTRLSHGVFS